MTTLSRPAAVLAWVLQIALAAMYFFAAANKFSGDPMMVQYFGALGLGQWFRYFTATIETAGAVGLLIPRFAPLAALVLMMVMIGAVISHFIVGGSPMMPIVLFLALGTVVYLRRAQLHLPVVGRSR